MPCLLEGAALPASCAHPGLGRRHACVLAGVWERKGTRLRSPQGRDLEHGACETSETPLACLLAAPQDIFRPGERIHALVIGFDPGFGNVAFSTAELEERPGDIIYNKRRCWANRGPRVCPSLWWWGAPTVSSGACHTFPCWHQGNCPWRNAWHDTQTAVTRQIPPNTHICSTPPGSLQRNGTVSSWRT